MKLNQILKKFSKEQSVATAHATEDQAIGTSKVINTS
jgi:hypothetical protein